MLNFTTTLAQLWYPCNSVGIGAHSERSGKELNARVKSLAERRAGIDGKGWTV
jgi:hypothetical protein